jgi:hypothetical protein
MHKSTAPPDLHILVSPPSDGISSESIPFTLWMARLQSMSDVI